MGIIAPIIVLKMLTLISGILYLKIIVMFWKMKNQKGIITLVLFSDEFTIK